MLCARVIVYATGAWPIDRMPGQHLTSAELSKPSGSTRRFLDRFFLPCSIMPWEDGWKSPGIRASDARRRARRGIDSSCGGSLIFVNAVKGATSSHSKEIRPVRVPLDYVCLSERLTDVLWSGWSMDRNRLASVGKRLPGRVLVVVLVPAVSSAAGWPLGAGPRVRLRRRPRTI
jgi:hypothetical protein